MPQKALWEPTASLVAALAQHMTTKRNRAVKQNELIDEALQLYASTTAEMTPAQIAEARSRPIVRRAAK